MNSTLKLKVPRPEADVTDLRGALTEYMVILECMTKRLKVAENQLAEARLSRDGWKSKYVAVTKPKEKAPEVLSSEALVPNSQGE